LASGIWPGLGGGVGGVSGGGGVVVGSGFLSSIAVIFSSSSSFVSSSPFSTSASTAALAVGVRNSSLTLLLSSALSINSMTSTKLFPPVLSSSTLRRTSPTFRLRESANGEGIDMHADVAGPPPPTTRSCPPRRPPVSHTHSPPASLCPIRPLSPPPPRRFWNGGTRTRCPSSGGGGSIRDGWQGTPRIERWDGRGRWGTKEEESDGGRGELDAIRDMISSKGRWETGTPFRCTRVSCQGRCTDGRRE